MRLAWAEESTVPAEFDGGQILGDEFVCEDAAASIDRYVFPPENVSQFLTSGRRNLNHLESTSCPDGPRGHTFLMHFTQPLAKTLGIMAGDAAHMLDKEYIAWLKEYSDRENRLFGREEVPENFYAMHGTGPFVPTDLNPERTRHIRRQPQLLAGGVASVGSIPERGYQRHREPVHGCWPQGRSTTWEREAGA